MEVLYPEDTESDDSMEGTASHELAAIMVDSASRARTDWPTNAVGQSASNGVIWTQESYDAAEMFADTVYEVMLATNVFTPQIEKRVEITRIHPLSWGTPDCWLLDIQNMTLYIEDYKYGHRPVEAFMNWQMIEYIAGILDALQAKGLSDTDITVVATIVQPRAPHRLGPVRSWTFNGADIRGHVNQLVDVERESLEDDPPTCTGSECRDCTARHACDTLQGASGSVMEFMGQSIPVNLDANALGTELVLLDRAYEILRARKSGLEAQGEAMIQAGDIVPCRALESGYGRRKWNVPATEIFAMCDLLGVDIRKACEPMTPKQSLKLGVDESVIKEYSIIPRTSAKLVPDLNNKAKEVFSK